MTGTAKDFRLPDLGEGLPEAELVQWTVAVGDTVRLNQTIAEVETAKAVVELPSPHAGVVSALHAAPGDTVDVGAVIITFELPATDSEAPDGADAPDAAQPNLVGYGAAPRGSGRPRRRARAASGRAAGATALLDGSSGRARGAFPAMPTFDDAPAERPRSTPPVRTLARDLGVDLVQVPGTGPDGLVTREDVERFAAAATPQGPGPAAASTATSRARGETRIPIRGVRRRTAEAMVQSAFTAPHVTVFLTVDVTATVELIASLKGDRALDGHRIGVLAIAAKAACLALGAHPGLNSAWDEAAGEIVQRDYVDLGIAAATERGLVVPNIRDAESLTLVDLADAIGDLATSARAGTTPPSAMTGGTFSITNVGVFGVDAGTPILVPGQAGILALGAVARRPWEHDGAVALRDVMTLALSFDHRLVDGEQGARFLADVGAVLREPGRAMLLR